MDIEKVKGLSAGEARLGMVYLLLGGQAGETSSKEVMRLAGLKDRSNFYRFRKRLEDAGFVVKARADTYRVSSAMFSASSALGSLHSPKPDLIGYDQIRSNLSNLSEPELERLLERSREEGAVNVALSPGVNADIGSANTDIPSANADIQGANITPSANIDICSANITPPLTLYDRCLDADDMDGTGSETSRNSPFYRRRQVQLPLMKEVWKQFFPNVLPLSDQYAKDYLAWCDNKVSMFYDGVEALVSRVKDIRSPIKFMNTALRGWVAERNVAPAPRPQGTRPSATTSPAPRRLSAYEAITKGDKITADELTPVSDEERQRMKEYAEQYEHLFD